MILVTKIKWVSEDIIKITITDREEQKYEKIILLGDNDSIREGKISYFELILKDNDNSIFTKKFVLCCISYKRYLLFKIELYDIQFYENYFFLSKFNQKLGFEDCKNPEQLI